MKRIISIIDSLKLELSLIGITVLSIIVKCTNIPNNSIPLAISTALLLLIYLFRALFSFRYWKFSRGIAIINVLINFEMSYIVMGMCYTFLKWPDYGALIYMAIISLPQMILLWIGLFLIFRWRGLRKDIYWSYLKGNIMRSVLGIIICLFTFYGLDIPSKVKKYPPVDIGIFQLPNKLF
jgi:hypothetical protein